MPKGFKDVCVLKKDGKEIKRGAFSVIARELRTSQEVLRKCAKTSKVFKGYGVEFVKIEHNYYAYKVDGQLVFKGTQGGVASFVGITPNTISKYANTGIAYKNKFIFKKEDVEIPVVEKKKIEKSKHELDYEYLLRHLKEYGNTVFNLDPTEYIWELRENTGWNIRAIPKEKNRWILEVVK